MNTALIMAIIIASISMILVVGSFIYTYYRTKDKTNSVTTKEIDDGSVTNAKLALGSVKSANIDNFYHMNNGNRYIEEYFYRVPTIVATAVANSAITGTVYSSGLSITFKEIIDANSLTLTSNGNGLKMVTSGASGDGGSVISLIPFASTAQQFDFVTSFSVSQITKQTVKIGLCLSDCKLASGDDATQAFFLYDTDDTYGYGTGSGSNGSKLFFVYSVSGTDYVSMLPVSVAANTIYNLKIRNSSTYKLSIWVNDVQYNINSTSSGLFTNLAAQTMSAGTSTSLTLASANLLATTRFNTSEASAKTMYVNYFKSLSIVQTS